MAALQSFTLGGVWWDAHPGNFGVLRCILVHSEATEKHTELLERRIIIVILIAC